MLGPVRFGSVRLVKAERGGAKDECILVLSSSGRGAPVRRLEWGNWTGVENGTGRLAVKLGLNIELRY